MLTFNQIVEPMFESIRNLQQHIINLRRTRDLLLPRLISGAVDVAGLAINELTA